MKTHKTPYSRFSMTCEYGVIPADFTHSKTITLPKKGNFTVCSNYRTIALLLHPSKILLNVIKNRIKKRIDDEQFGFKSGRGTREAILSLREILERRIMMDKSTYVAFVDLEKAFDKVNWKLLFRSLRKASIDWKDRRFVFKSNKNQATIIDINGHKEEAEIKQGVRQGCPLSPY